MHPKTVFSLPFNRQAVSATTALVVPPLSLMVVGVLSVSVNVTHPLPNTPKYPFSVPKDPTVVVEPEAALRNKASRHPQPYAPNVIPQRQFGTKPLGTLNLTKETRWHVLHTSRHPQPYSYPDIWGSSQCRPVRIGPCGLVGTLSLLSPLGKVETLFPLAWEDPEDPVLLNGWRPCSP